MRSNWPGMNSTCQLVFLADLLRILPQQGQGFLSSARSCTLRVTGRLSKRRQVPPAATNPPHRASFGQRFIWRKIVGIHRPRFQFGGERQQHLGHVAGRLEPVGSRTVVPLLQPKQFRFDAQELDVPVIALLVFARHAGERSHHVRGKD